MVGFLVANKFVGNTVNKFKRLKVKRRFEKINMFYNFLLGLFLHPDWRKDKDNLKEKVSPGYFGQAV